MFAVFLRIKAATLVLVDVHFLFFMTGAVLELKCMYEKVALQNPGPCTLKE